jgi:hypothetical protein
MINGFLVIMLIYHSSSPVKLLPDCNIQPLGDNAVTLRRLCTKGTSLEHGAGTPQYTARISQAFIR